MECNPKAVIVCKIQPKIVDMGRLLSVTEKSYRIMFVQRHFPIQMTLEIGAKIYMMLQNQYLS